MAGCRCLLFGAPGGDDAGRYQRLRRRPQQAHLRRTLLGWSTKWSALFSCRPSLTRRVRARALWCFDPRSVAAELLNARCSRACIVLSEASVHWCSVDAQPRHGGAEGATLRRHLDAEEDEDASTDGSATEPEAQRQAQGPVADDGDKALLDGLLCRLLPALVECMLPSIGGRQLSADGCKVSLYWVPALAGRLSTVRAMPQRPVKSLIASLQVKGRSFIPVFWMAACAARWDAVRALPPSCCGS